MGLFSKLFKPKPKKVVETQLGQFTLVYHKKGKCTWSNNNGEYLRSVRGLLMMNPI